MAKMKKILGLAMAAVLCTASVMPALAEGASETYKDENGVTFTTTTTVTEEGKNTVTVTIEEWDNEDAEGAEVAIEGIETTTVTENSKKETTVVDGSETQTWFEEDDGNEAGQIEVEVELIPGEKTTATGTEVTVTDNIPGGSTANNSDITTTTTTDRTVTAETSEKEVEFKNSNAELLAPIEPVKNVNKADDLANYWTDPGTTTVTGEAPDGYAYQMVGNGQQSYQYVNRIYVVYEKDEAGNPIKDENGDYVIKELRKVTSKVNEVLTVDGVPTTDINAVFDQKTGTTAAQGMLMDEDGNAVYVYCIDLGMDVPDNTWYAVGNLEDVDYFASEEAEKHVRNIVTNGYWGSAEGTGSLALLKQKMKDALKAGEIESEIEISYRSESGEAVTETVILTDEIIDGLTSGEALDMTQVAIWSYSNGSLGVQDGRDGYIVGNVAYGDSSAGNRSGKDDPAGMARMTALYNWLIGLEDEQESIIVINEKNSVKDVSLTIKDKVSDSEKNADDDKDNDVYHAEMNFTLAFVPDKESDDLLVYLTDADGNPLKDAAGKPIVRRLAGENSEDRSAETILPDENGVYTLTGLQLQEKSDFTFDLRLEGTQYLEQGVYLYTAESGIDVSQTLVGLAEGTHNVDVSVGMTISFDVDENDKVVAERKWHKSASRNKTTGRTEDPSTTVIPDEGVPMAASADGLVEIIDEEVPLAAAPETGDNSIVYVLVSLISLAGAAVLLLKRRTA